MQATAFLALQCRADDEIGDCDQVAQLDQVIGDPVVTVKLADFAGQQVNPVFRPLQALGGSDNADTLL